MGAKSPHFLLHRIQFATIKKQVDTAQIYIVRLEHPINKHCQKGRRGNRMYTFMITRIDMEADEEKQCTLFKDGGRSKSHNGLNTGRNGYLCRMGLPLLD